MATTTRFRWTLWDADEVRRVTEPAAALRYLGPLMLADVTVDDAAAPTVDAAMQAQACKPETAGTPAELPIVTTVLAAPAVGVTVQVPANGTIHFDAMLVARRDDGGAHAMLRVAALFARGAGAASLEGVSVIIYKQPAASLWSARWSVDTTDPTRAALVVVGGVTEIVRWNVAVLAVRVA